MLVSVIGTRFAIVMLAAPIVVDNFSVGAEIVFDNNEVEDGIELCQGEEKNQGEGSEASCWTARRIISLVHHGAFWL